MIAAQPSARVYDAERRLMAALPDGDLMKRAVDRLVATLLERRRGTSGTRLVALVGNGNNGADALYAAARLSDLGWNCSALTLQTVHAGARASALAAGVDLAADPSVLERADVVLDGILGIGSRPGLPAAAAGWVRMMPPNAYVVAVDVPSGLDPDSGALSAPAVRAHETVTFAVAKPALLLPPAALYAGRLTVCDIGLTVAHRPDLVRLEDADVAAAWPTPAPAATKYRRGVLGIVAGGATYPGAAVLTTTAAVCSGAGMVRYLGPARARDLVQQSVPEAVCQPGAVDAWVLGPGVTAGDGQPERVLAALGEPRAAVVDAGALDAIDPAIMGQRTAGGVATVLTPHAGECARLLSRLGPRKVSAAEVEAQPLVSAQTLAEMTGATVLLKGAATLVATASPGPTYSQGSAPAWLATAGAGDVLAGLLGTLLASGVPAAAAAAMAAHVHGLAAHRANPGGPVRALAVAEALGGTIASLLTADARPGQG